MAWPRKRIYWVGGQRHRDRRRHAGGAQPDPRAEADRASGRAPLRDADRPTTTARSACCSARRSSAGNRVDALQNGDEIFPAMLAAIRGARRTINFESYIYWSGDIGQVVRRCPGRARESRRAGARAARLARLAEDRESACSTRCATRACRSTSFIRCRGTTSRA